MNTRVGRCLSASKSGQSSALREAWHLQWRGSALDIAAIEGPGDVSPIDGRTQVVCAAGCTQADKAMASMSSATMKPSVNPGVPE